MSSSTQIVVGSTARLERKITRQDIQTFITLTGDNNPIHWDDAFAKTTPFQRPIAHGLLCGSLVSKLLACDLPGPGTVYLEQTFTFLKPVFIDDVLTVSVTVTHIRTDKPILTLQTCAKNQHDQVVYDGQAVVKVQEARLKTA